MVNSDSIYELSYEELVEAKGQIDNAIEKYEKGNKISKLEGEVKELKGKISELGKKEYETKEPEMISFLVHCNKCDGKGNILGQKCNVCDGTGSAVRTREVQPCDYEGFNHSYPNNGF